MTSPGSFFPINNTTNTEFNRIRLDRTKTSTDSQRSMTRHQREKAGLVHACGPLFHTPQLPKAPPISWDAPRRFTVRCFGAVRAWTQKVDISLLHPYRVVGVCNSSRNNRSCLCASLLWWSGACVFGHGVQLMWLILLIGQQSGTRWGFEKTQILMENTSGS